MKPLEFNLPVTSPDGRHVHVTVIDGDEQFTIRLSGTRKPIRLLVPANILFVETVEDLTHIVNITNQY